MLKSLRASGCILLALLSAGVLFAAQDPPDKTAEQLLQDAQQKLLAGAWEAAEKGFREVLRRDPASVPAHANLGVVYMRTRRYREALDAFTQASRLAPEVAGIHLNLGLASLQLAEFKHAAGHFERAAELNPGDTRTRYLLGLSCYMADNYQGAIASLAPLYPHFSSQLDYLYILGTSYGKTGEEKEAARIFDQMFKVGGDSPRIRWLLGNAYLTQQVNQKAVEELEAARADPRLPYVHYSLGLAYYRVKRLEEAARVLDEEIKLNPDFPSLYGLKGTVMLDLRRLDEAVASYRKALELKPNQAAAYYGLGRVSLLKGDVAQAVAHLERAAQLTPDDDSIQFQLGQAYRRAGRNEDAAKALARAQKLQADEREFLERKVLGELPPSPVQPSTLTGND